MALVAPSEGTPQLFFGGVLLYDAHSLRSTHGGRSRLSTSIRCRVVVTSRGECGWMRHKGAADNFSPKSFAQRSELTTDSIAQIGLASRGTTLDSGPLTQRTGASAHDV